MAHSVRDARFFINDTATTEIYPLSLHDALPISRFCSSVPKARIGGSAMSVCTATPIARPPQCAPAISSPSRSEEHTSELQSRQYFVCRLLLEKKTLTHHAVHMRGHTQRAAASSY